VNPILVELYRGEVNESFHRGVVCVVNGTNEIEFSRGDVKQVCYPRSAMKLFQHIPLIVSGAFDHFKFTLQELAVMCGSHNGEHMHMEVVDAILKKIGLSESNLKCGAQAPTLKSDLYQLIKNDLKPRQLHNNCSGKHAGFLAYCTFKGLDFNDYISANSELQKEIKKVVSVFYEFPEDELKCGMDGCSAPTFAMPVVNQAIAFKNLISPAAHIPEEYKKAAEIIVSACSEFPEMLAGTNRYCTDLIKITQGRIIGKTGADGVYCIADKQKNLGISIKIDDGKMGPQYQVAQELLSHLDLISPEEIKQLEPYHEFELSNFSGNIVGKSVAVNFE
jgi:L-asparaginase II